MTDIPMQTAVQRQVLLCMRTASSHTQTTQQIPPADSFVMLLTLCEYINTAVLTMTQSREHLHQNYPHTLLCRNLRQIIRRSDCCCTKKESSPACRILRVISKARTTMTGCLNWQRTARATTCRQLTTV